MTQRARNWLITGCSTGLGRALAHVLIACGERVFASARRPEQLEDLVAGHEQALNSFGIILTRRQQPSDLIGQVFGDDPVERVNRALDSMSL